MKQPSGNGLGENVLTKVSLEMSAVCKNKGKTNWYPLNKAVFYGVLFNKADTINMYTGIEQLVKRMADDGQPIFHCCSGN